ncbi:hypothetical protein RJ639_027352 [Escallonia herrerae]|uniref:S-acyltransferase n=1 Tax=Escallonia herrerae TaxID=1293975 RepID=A0AA88XHA7_9ASTE|nr:hypothetical protein RJ639_027352 [Escallonia herrerae]
MDLNMFRCCSGLRLLGYLIVVLVAAIVAVSYYAVVVVTWGPHLLDGGSQWSFEYDTWQAIQIAGKGRHGERFRIILWTCVLIIVQSFYPSFIPEIWKLTTFIVLVLLKARLKMFSILQLALLTWSYFMVVVQDPGSVPENWKPSVEEGSSLTASETWPSSDGLERRPAVGYCSHCQNGKPPRCHHCSVCQRCVLKMDHHCIWVVNCVGARNYKFFLLFVFYTFLETTMDTLALLPCFIKFFREAKHHSISPSNLAITFLAFVLNLAFALSLLCFVIMHLSLLSSNTTSVEVHEKKKAVRWKYDMGRKKNFEQVFGCRKALWFFPLFSKEDLEKIPALHGLDFPTLTEVSTTSFSRSVLTAIPNTCPVELCHHWTGSAATTFVSAGRRVGFGQFTFRWAVVDGDEG